MYISNIYSTSSTKPICKLIPRFIDKHKGMEINSNIRKKVKTYRD